MLLKTTKKKYEDISQTNNTYKWHTAQNKTLKQQRKVHFLLSFDYLLFSWLIYKTLIITFWITMIIMFWMCTWFIMDLFYCFSWKSFLNLNKELIDHWNEYYLHTGTNTPDTIWPATWLETTLNKKKKNDEF
jgi:hypothetical protein